MYIYKRTRDLREDNDKTQKQIADILNVGLTTYRRWETGEREIPFHVIIELAKYYNVSIDYLAGLTKDPAPHWSSKNINNSFNNNSGTFGNITIK